VYADDEIEFMERKANWAEIKFLVEDDANERK